MTPDLSAEMVASMDTLPPVRHRLLAAGIDEMTLLRYPGPIGFARIAIGRLGSWAWFEPDCDAETEAVIAPVWSAAAFSVVIDLVAWEIGRPGRFWTRTGVGGLMGWANFDAAELCNRGLFLVATPQSWIAAGGLGACVLDWSIAPRLRCLQRLVAETVPFGQFVRGQLVDAAPAMPEMHVATRRVA